MQGSCLSPQPHPLPPLQLSSGHMGLILAPRRNQALTYPWASSCAPSLQHSLTLPGWLLRFIAVRP